MPPRQPHLLAGGVERDRQAGEHSVAWSQRILLQEHPGLGVDECRGVTVADCNTFGGSGRTRGEDHPRVVLGCGQLGHRSTGTQFGRILFRRGAGSDSARSDDGRHLRLTEDQFGALFRIVGIDGYVRSPDVEDRQNRDIEREGPRRHPDADAVTAPDTGVGEPLGTLGDVVQQFGVADRHRPVVDRGCIREAIGGLL